MLTQHLLDSPTFVILQSVVHNGGYIIMLLLQFFDKSKSAVSERTFEALFIRFCKYIFIVTLLVVITSVSSKQNDTRCLIYNTTFEFCEPCQFHLPVGVILINLEPIKKLFAHVALCFYSQSKSASHCFPCI